MQRQPGILSSWSQGGCATQDAAVELEKMSLVLSLPPIVDSGFRALGLEVLWLAAGKARVRHHGRQHHISCLESYTFVCEGQFKT